MKIIALYGPQKSGKSEAAKALATTPGWAKLSFADPLYSMLSVLIGCDARKLDKAQPADGTCGKTVREALQLLGTEWGRQMIGETVWLDYMDRELRRLENSGVPGVVIDDLRFANEYEFLRTRGAEIVRILRPGVTQTMTHASETDWGNFEPDFAVLNDSDFAEWGDYWSNISERPAGPKNVNYSIRGFGGIQLRVICPNCGMNGANSLKYQPKCHKCWTLMLPASNSRTECTWAEFVEFIEAKFNPTR